MNRSRPKIRLGTRASQLATTQSRWVKNRLESLGVDVELVIIRTEGDNNQLSLTQIGGQGVFTSQLQTALRQGQIDLAVHSLKDLPTQQVDDLRVAAIPVRENPADALISANGLSFADLPGGSSIGTGSLRRAAQLRHLRSDVELRDIRGNVDTRLSKLDAGEIDAIVLAAAGLNRLGLAHRITQVFDLDRFYPAIGQGALGLEIRTQDVETAHWVSQLNDRDSFACVMAERAMLRSLEAGCLSAVGANCVMEQGRIILSGIVLSPDGRRAVTANAAGNAEAYESIGFAVAESLLDRGARKLLEILR